MLKWSCLFEFCQVSAMKVSGNAPTTVTSIDGRPDPKPSHALDIGPELQLSFLPHETLVWQQGPTLGTGRFGQVMLAMRVPNAEFLAVKHMYVQEECDQGNDTSSLCMQRVLPVAKIEREIGILESVQHPNIVRYFGAERVGPVYRLFMEYVPAGSLSTILKQLGPFNEIAARHFVRQLADGIAYLHRLGIAHRDLKCANLLLADNGTVKITDFGAAKRIERGDDDNDDDHETARSVRDGLGSPYWMAPELVRAERGEDGWRKADVWGIGCVMVELMTGRPPWENHSNPLTAMFHIAAKDTTPTLPPNLSDRARAFLSACFDKNPKTRSEASALLLHPFLARDSDGLGTPSLSQPPASALELSSSENAGQSELVVNNPSQSTDSTPIAAIASSTSSEADESSSIDDITGTGYSSDGSEDNTRTSELDERRPSLAATVRRPSASAFSWTELGRVRALADYSASDENELNLREGETMVVAGVNEFGWYRGKHEDSSSTTTTVGWFPCTYVEWIPGDKCFEVKRQHDPSQDLTSSLNQLALIPGSFVNVVHCEWQGDRLWAYGNLQGSTTQAWFPFACIVDHTVY